MSAIPDLNTFASWKHCNHQFVVDILISRNSPEIESKPGKCYRKLERIWLWKSCFPIVFFSTKPIHWYFACFAIEIVSFPIKQGGSFHSFVTVYQRVWPCGSSLSAQEPSLIECGLEGKKWWRRATREASVSSGNCLGTAAPRREMKLDMSVNRMPSSRFSGKLVHSQEIWRISQTSYFSHDLIQKTTGADDRDSWFIFYEIGWRSVRFFSNQWGMHGMFFFDYAPLRPV